MIAKSCLLRKDNFHFVPLQQRPAFQIAQGLVWTGHDFLPFVRPDSTSMSVAPVMPVVTGTNLARSLPLGSLSTTKTPCTGLGFAAGVETDAA